MLILYYFHVETLFRAFEIYLSNAIPIQRKMSINIPSLFFKFTFSRVVSPYVFRTRLRAVGFVRLRRGQQITLDLNILVHDHHHHHHFKIQGITQRLS